MNDTPGTLGLWLDGTLSTPLHLSQQSAWPRRNG
jgi:hypothetical protein